MANPARWLGGHAPCDDARTRGEGTSMLSGIRKEQRHQLTPKDLLNLKAKAEEGMEYKFKIMGPLDGKRPTKDKLKVVYSVNLRIEEFRAACKRFDMADVFQIASAYSLDADKDEYRPAVGCRPIHLFNSHSDVTLDTVKKASAFYFLRGQDFHVQNLLWTGEKILNSCDEELRKKLEEQCNSFPIEHQSSPVYFKILIMLVTVTSTALLRTLINYLNDLGLSDFNGENVIQYTSVVRGIVDLLGNTFGQSMVPLDIMSLIAKGLKKGTTTDFTVHVTALMTAHETHIRVMTPEDFLVEAKNKYASLVSEEGGWNAGGAKGNDQDSVFFLGNCHNCGQKGRMAKDCRLPKKDNDAGRHGGGRSGRGRSRGGRGRGRSGGRGGTDGESQPTEDDKKKPPKPGDPKQRNKDGKVEFWGGCCALWTDHNAKCH